MNAFQVGGSVRDELLGLSVNDRDWVVVGATIEEMLQAGFKPVGKDFPVFLHPRTHEEYALARTERKTAPGYTGFVFHADPDVTLEADLERRDLTINAIARRPDGSYVDPYNGKADLEARVFRHVSVAFAEDPVRILRIARFAARFVDFTIASETMELMKRMVVEGEVDALVPERVWQEISRGLMEPMPSRLFQTLRACGALARLLPELDCLFGVPQPALHHPEVDTGVHVMMVVDMAARMGLDLPARYAALLHDLGKGTTDATVLPRHFGHEERSVELVREVSLRLKVPADCRDLAVIVAREHGKVGRIAELRAGTIVDLLERTDGFRKPARFESMLGACEADSRGRLGFTDRPFEPREHWLAALRVAREIDAGAIAARFPGRPDAIKGELHAARVRAVAALRRET